jgi:hypothetical protein
MSRRDQKAGHGAHRVAASCQSLQEASSSRVEGVLRLGGRLRWHPESHRPRGRRPESDDRATRRPARLDASGSTGEQVLRDRLDQLLVVERFEVVGGGQVEPPAIRIDTVL